MQMTTARRWASMLQIEVPPNNGEADQSKQEIRPMRNRIATLAAVSALALALSASPALAGSPAIHDSFDATGVGFWCGTDTWPSDPPTYAITYGTFDYVMAGTSSPSGNWILTGTVTPRNFLAVDTTGNQYSVVGVEHFSETYNAQTGIVITTIDGNDVSQAVTTLAFQIVSSRGGGTVASFNLVQSGSPNGHFNFILGGTCTDVR